MSKPIKRKKKVQTERETIYNVVRRLYYLLRHSEHKIEFKKLYGRICGYFYYDSNEIVIDFRKQLIPTLVHEALHKWYEDWSETKVLNAERWIVNRLTPRQIKHIIKILGNNL